MSNKNTAMSTEPAAKPSLIPKPNVRRIRFSKYGLAENPVGLQVAMPWKGRELLGDVIACDYNFTRGVFEMTVRHFCGDLWPIQPIASAVEIIG